MDRNQVIGFSLLAVLLIAYISYTSYSQKEFQKQQQHIADSIARTNPTPKVDSVRSAVAAGNIPGADTTQSVDTIGQSLLPPALQKNAKAEIIALENKDIKLEFSTLGAYPLSAHLKQYKTYDSTPLYLFSGTGNKFSLGITGVEGAAATESLHFTPQKIGDTAVNFIADLGNGRQIALQYVLPIEGYLMKVKVQYTGIPGSSLPMTWTSQTRHTEHDIISERTNSQMYYRYTNDEHDYYTIKEDNEKKELNDAASVQWVGFRMHYFNSTVIADAGMSDTRVVSTTKMPDSSLVASQTTTAKLAMGGDGTANLHWYIGPNHYQTLKNLEINGERMGMQEMIPLGFGPFFFVKYINMWLIIPVFNFLKSFGINMGIIIMLLTIFIRLLLSFFTYKSYLSSAKMRVLKPELDELKKKIGDDQQKMGVEQMKLYKSAGVSPLGGCLPTLFQIPILFAMYYFFPSSIELRQKSFLWANDLSTYDSIASWSTHIPLLSSVYGNHISLFTLLMTVSSMFLALYNRNMTPQADNNPIMKWMPFIFPIILMGVFNKMAAALTFYYFFSNLISIVQQWFIQKFVIDEDKIHAQLQMNKLKPVTPSKWTAKMEEIQKAQAARKK